MAVSPSVLQQHDRSWGSVPSKWALARFGDVLERVERPVELDAATAYRQPVIRRGHGGIQLREIQAGRDIKTKKQFLLHTGDWLMSKVQILHGAYGIVPPELDGAIASGTYFSFRPKSSLDLQFFWYLSQCQQFHRSCELSSVGVVIEKMVFRVDDWLQFRLPLPPIAEQRKIAAILSSVDDTIEKTEAVIDQLEVVKKGLLGELLTRGMPGRHKKFKDTEVGRFPDSWGLARVSDVAQVRGGKRMPKGRPFAGCKTPFPYIRVSDFANGTIRTDDLQYVLPDDQVQIRAYTISSADLYISIAGTLGLVGQIPDELDGAQLTENAAKICAIDTRRVLKSFLMLAMTSESVERQIGTLKGVGGGVPKLALFRIESIQVPLPPLEEQASIIAIMESNQARLEKEREFLLQSQVLKSGLLDALLSGRIRVSPHVEVAA